MNSPGNNLWQPPIPLAEIAPQAVRKAVSLRRALARALQLRHDPKLLSCELEAAALADYQREFGFAVSDRTIRSLLKRTIERDNLAENFSRLEIYLDGNPPRKAAAEPARLVGEEHYRELHDTAATFADPAHPRSRERESLWLCAAQTYQARLRAGGDARAIRIQLINFLWRSFPWMARSKNALRVAFASGFEGWQASQCDPAFFRDGREARRGIPTKPPVSEQFSNMLAYHTAKYCGGRLAQAVREFADALGVEETLVDELLQFQPADKTPAPAPTSRRDLTQSLSVAAERPAQSAANDPPSPEQSRITFPDFKKETT